MENSHIIADISLCIVVAWLLALVARLLRQPLIIAYLGAGLLVGPVGFGWIRERESITTIAELGLIFLLFMIGLEIDLKKVLGAGRAIVVTAAVQILGGCGLGFFFLKLLALRWGGTDLDALYLTISAALSSTVIIVKILHDKRELDTLVGRITLGVLVAQDLFAILFLAVQGTLKEPAVGPLMASLFRVVVLVATALMSSRYVLPPLFRAVAQLPELVLVGALAWCFLVCSLAQLLGLSREMGALIAGVALSTFPYALDVTAKVTTLRDFFLTLFFVALGMSIPKPTASLLLWAMVYSAFLIGSRLVTVFVPLHSMRLGHRASLLPAVNLCQVSEFSLVIVALGVKAGDAHSLTQGVVAYAFAFLAVVSSYTIVRNEAVLRRFSPLLRWLGAHDLGQAAGPADEVQGDKRGRPIQILGFFWTASSLVEEFARHSPDLLQEISVIDFNPQVNDELRRRGIPVIYGDISQRDTLSHAGVDRASIILCTIPNGLLKNTTNLRLVQQLRDINPKATIIAHAELFDEIPKLYAAGADFVSVPRLVEAQELYEVVRAAKENRLERKRLEQEEELKDRREVIH
ncbi:MAG TPA: cation:proton antiporter [Candidatus Limnocylindrales bacterium]|jgi:Kef-type K+ transport system membrane component KefB|nr:cation:proton antiporter [Candidatus Limnocylindrales bacterium]